MKEFKCKYALPFGSAFGFTMLVSLTASAAPAVVNKFEVAAREAPSVDATVVEVLSEQTKLSVSEEATDGWRRARLPDGKTAFIRDEDVRLATSASGRIQPLPREAAGQGIRSTGGRIYVKDLDHLSVLVEEDPMVQPKAAALARRELAGKALGWGGLIGAILGTAAGMTLLAGQTCDAGYSCLTDYNDPVIYGSLAVGLVAATIGWAIRPNRSDVVDVLNEWNRRHANAPFTFDRQPSFTH
jgi:hypothetical protein